MSPHPTLLSVTQNIWTTAQFPLSPRLESSCYCHLGQRSSSCEHDINTSVLRVLCFLEASILELLQVAASHKVCQMLLDAKGFKGLCISDAICGAFSQAPAIVPHHFHVSWGLKCKWAILKEPKYDKGNNGPLFWSIPLSSVLHLPAALAGGCSQYLRRAETS